MATSESVVVICVEASESLVEPMCSTAELQQELVPYVMSQLLQSSAFMKLSKPERQTKVKMLTQKMLGGETGTGGPDDDAAGDIAPHRFWAHLRTKYGTRLAHLLQLLKHLESAIRHHRVVLLLFQSEVAAPTASLLVRASRPCSAAAVEAAAAARREFAAGSFQVEAVSEWLSGSPDSAGGHGRAPPLWLRLAAECASDSVAEVRALVVCTEAQSTDTTPEALTLAAHALHQTRKVVPFVSSVTFGPQSSERLAALSEFSAWAGGLSFNVSDVSGLQPAAQGLSSYSFNGELQAKDFLERRQSYAQKQALSACCYLPLPPLLSDGPAHSSSLVDALRGGAKVAFDATCPSESLLAVLSDTTLALPRRWGRSLRCCRELRGLRDVVFGEPGGLGLELDEPKLGDETSERQRTWRLRTTHPPASALKMKEQSVLLAINFARVHEHTARSEIARRVSARPVSLTFENPKRDPGCETSAAALTAMTFAAAAGEIVVGELREKLQPLRKDAAPLSSVLARAAATRGSTAAGIRQRQAARLLDAVASWGAGASAAPAWAERLPEGDPVRGRLAGAHALAREPGCLYRALLFCADAACLARVGLATSSLHRLVLHDVRRRQAGDASPQHRLWSWAFRWGAGPARSQRIAFWRWLLGTGSAPPPHASTLEAAAAVDGPGLLGLAAGLAGACPGLGLAQHMLEGAAAVAGAPAMPPDVAQGLLAPPLHGQRLWLLTADALPWLVLQARCFQVAIAAYQPQLFRHFMGEGVAPELFFCRWLQTLFRGCAAEAEVAQLLDLFVHEGSCKIFVRAAVALFGLLEAKLRGDVDQIVQALYEPEAWGLAPGALLQHALQTKVTRSMLRDMVAGEAACDGV